MNVCAAIADSLLRQAFGGQARPRDLDVLFHVRLGPSGLHVPVSPLDCAISPRTVMNNED